MPVRVQLSRSCHRRQNFTLEVIAVPEVERPSLDDEETGIDPVVRKPRLLQELADAAALIRIQRAERGWQRCGSDGHRTRVSTVELEERPEIDRAKTVAVGGHEDRTEPVGATGHSPRSTGILAGVDHPDCPPRRKILGELLDQVGTIPRREDEFVEPLAGIDFHDVKEDWRSPHLHQRLRDLQRVRVRPRPLSPAQDQDLHTRPTAITTFPPAAGHSTPSVGPSASTLPVAIRSPPSSAPLAGASGAGTIIDRSTSIADRGVLDRPL